MSTLTELLACFPEYWDTDPVGRPALRITYAGDACWVKIEDDMMEIIPQGGMGKRHTINLTLVLTDIYTHIPYQMRLGDLVTQINTWANEGFHAEVIESSFKFFTDGTAHLPDLNNVWRQRPLIYTNYPYPTSDPPLTDPERNEDITNQYGLHPYKSKGWYLNEPTTNRPLMIPGFGNGMSDIGAVVLIDGMYNIVENNVIQGTTNLLWQILKPIAYTLRRAKQYGSELVRQIDLRSAEGPWLDRWGSIYGVKRIYPESDIEFRNRLSYTSFKPRVSTSSMENALILGLGALDAHVTDLVTPFKFQVQAIFPMNKTYYMGKSVKEIIESYRAAGTFYDVEELVLDKQDIVAPYTAIRLTQAFTGGVVKIWYGGNAVTAGITIDFAKISDTSFRPGTDVSLVGGSEFGEQLVG